MAKSPTPKAPEPEAPAKRTFSFEVRKGLTIPELPKASRPDIGFPWKDKFGTMEHNDEFFIPTSYWTTPVELGGRGADPTAAGKKGYERGKIRGSFNDWVKKDEANRKHFSVVLVPRSAGDNDGMYEEPGFSVFFQDRRKMAAAEDANKKAA